MSRDEQQEEYNLLRIQALENRVKELMECIDALQNESETAEEELKQIKDAESSKDN
jgi:hypothetical protein|tara:strand:- start:4319 stop:4486 length:168 start_codon:yes stop_codon:yes gene_type:complete